MLNRRGCELGTDRIHDRVALSTIFSINTDFDEFVSLEGVVDFLEHCRSQAIAGDADYGVKVVGLCAKRSPLGGSEFSHFATH